MDRERAEAHRVARALTAVGALDDETAKRILNEVELARALRHPDPTFRRHLSRAGAASLMPHPAPRRRAAAGRVVPIGQLVPVHAEDVSGAGARLGPFGAGPRRPAGPLAGFPPGYLMATALAGEPIPPGAFSGALTRNIS